MPVTVTTMRRTDHVPLGAMAHFDEDRYSLEKRVERLEGDHAWTEDPPSRARRFVTNVRVAPIDGSDDVEARSYLLLYRSRGDDRPADLVVGRAHGPPAPGRRVAGCWRRATSPSTRPCCARRTSRVLPVTGVLAGKVVVCTGGGSGIGRAAVEAFVAAGARWPCSSATRPSATRSRRLGDAVLAVAGDATTARRQRARRRRRR